MLKVKIVSTRVRTAALPRTQRKPSAMSWRTCVGPASASGSSGRGRTRREISSVPSRTSTPWAANGHAIPVAKRAAPIGGPPSWLTVMNPVCRRELAIARSSRSTIIGSRVWLALSANISAVPSRNSAASTTAIDTWPVTMNVVRTSQHPGPHEVDGDDDATSVEAVGERTGVQAEEQRRSPHRQRSQRHQEGLVGLGGHQERPGRDRDPVAEVGGPRRGEQPAERAPEASWGDDVDSPGDGAHKVGR